MIQFQVQKKHLFDMIKKERKFAHPKCKGDTLERCDLTRLKNLIEAV